MKCTSLCACYLLCMISLWNIWLGRLVPKVVLSLHLANVGATNSNIQVNTCTLLSRGPSQCKDIGHSIMEIRPAFTCKTESLRWYGPRFSLCDVLCTYSVLLYIQSNESIHPPSWIIVSYHQIRNTLWNRILALRANLQKNINPIESL